MPDCDPDTDKDNDVDKSPTFCDLLDFDLQRKSPGSNAHSVITLLGDSTNSTASDKFDPMETNVDDSTPTEVGSLHDLGVVGGYSFWLEEAYTNLYFSITHFMWPLLDCNAWGSWRHDWSLNEKPEPWKGFFVKMVHAIGSLSYNVLQPGQNHSKHAAEMYSSALSYYPYVMAEASAILQIQASILMVIYSLHCPSSGEISILRKIQANIRRSWDEPTDIQNSNDRSFKLALDDWRKDIPQYSVEEAQGTHLDPLWMTKLYDYSVIILMQGKRKCLMREDLDDILSAGVEACLNYRRLQEEGQVMCFTWSAVRLRWQVIVFGEFLLTYLP
ncbi:hypothetical protein APSETT444_004038 [Aspergillus pseudonomiae]